MFPAPEATASPRLSRMMKPQPPELEMA
uniref:Uncharacterized protein n=1 Tax=Arundo donax TaxID=35708 RepID=A0A0A9BT11_ARUDO